MTESVDPAQSDPTETMDVLGVDLGKDTAPPPSPSIDVSRHVRIFGSHAFFRLWLVQLVSATGDWLGFLALYGLAGEFGDKAAGGALAIMVVLVPRLVPGLFLASAGGVIVDRLNRKRLMIGCDVGRAFILLAIPLVDQLWWLVLASFFLEIATSLWGPAKEAIMPNLVPTSHLTNANSLSVAAAYGTFPLAAVIWLGLSKLAEWLSGLSTFSFLELNEIRLALAVDAMTFLVAAMLLYTIPIVPRSKEMRDVAKKKSLDFGSGYRDVKEGWAFILQSPRVKSVIIGLGVGMFGGGMLIPLSGGYNEFVLKAGDAGYGALLFSLGMGVAGGVALLTTLQRRISQSQTFIRAILAAGILVALSATTSHLITVCLVLAGVGVCAGAIYILGLTMLHSNVDDELRGRIFSAFYMIVRFALLIGIASGAAIAAFLGYLSNQIVDGSVQVFESAYPLPGVRLALWLAALVMIVAWWVARHAMAQEEQE